MLRRLYDWTLELAQRRNALWVLAAVGQFSTPKSCFESILKFLKLILDNSPTNYLVPGARIELALP